MNALVPWHILTMMAAIWVACTEIACKCLVSDGTHAFLLGSTDSTLDEQASKRGTRLMSSGSSLMYLPVWW
jgi:hypothetical protein